MWTIEQTFWEDHDGRKRSFWEVVDEDGEMVAYFDTEDEAKEWLAFQQAAAEEIATEV